MTTSKELVWNVMDNAGSFPAVKPTVEFCDEASMWLADVLGDNAVLSTVHGSFLYGSAHNKSDVDLYAVCPSVRKNKVVQLGSFDVQLFNLDTFVNNLFNGSHQAVEALMSPYKVVNRSHHFSAYMDSLRVNKYSFANKCQSAAISFAARGVGGEYGRELKMLRHSARLMDAVESSMKGGYSPVWREFGEFDEKEDKAFFRRALDLLDFYDNR